MSNIASIDNGTIVESFKFLNYCQLAKNSLVSKKLRDLIQTHRHRLAILYVYSIYMDYYQDSFQIEAAPIKVFDKELSPETYNEWVIRNDYSKEAPIDSQVASEESAQSITNGYELVANACYKDFSHREWTDRTTVFSAEVELNDKNWPLFQHFVRLVTDPFIYIKYVGLTYQNDILNVLAEAINSDHNLLQCIHLTINLKGNSQKSIIWITNHARCSELYIYDAGDLNDEDEACLNFFVTGTNCTQSIDIRHCDLSKAITEFVQKFMDLKHSCESQLVKAIKGKISVPAIELLKSDYAKFFVKEERHEYDDDGGSAKNLAFVLDAEMGETTPMEVIAQKDVFNLLAGAMSPNCTRLHCKTLSFRLRANSKKCITWIQNHVHCNKLFVGEGDLSQDEALLDFVMTGTHCTSQAIVTFYDISKAMVAFVQKFLDIENCDEYQCIQSIKSFLFVKDQDMQELKNDYIKFLVKEEHDEDAESITYVFEFINIAIKKKLQLTREGRNMTGRFVVFLRLSCREGSI